MKHIFICISVFILLSSFSFLSAQNQPIKNKKALAKKGNDLIVKGITASTSPALQECAEKGWSSPSAFANYKQALGIWTLLLKENPDNANINYKVALCYFFSYDEQLKALPYFKKAIQSTIGTYAFDDSEEQAAPYMSLYFLGQTLLENNQPDSALKYFNMYQDRHALNAVSTERGISMSINAKNAEKNPRNVKLKNLNAKINSLAAETNPVVTINNTLMFFSSRKKSGQDISGNTGDIYMCSKDGAEWNEPIPFPFNTSEDEAPLSISIDGMTLYFKTFKNGNYDLYKSDFKNNAWTKPEALKNLNSPSNEEGLSISADGKTIYLSSDRNKTTGFDIYKSTKSEKGDWSEPVLLNSAVNSPFDEISPYLTPDGLTLFFSSNFSASKGLGGFDIYYTELKGSNWSYPQNMGYPINKSRNDLNYYVASNDKRYFSALTQNNSYDLFEIEGGGFDFEAIAANTDVVTITNEMGITQVMETEKKVEKEVEVTQTIETEVIKEKEVEVVKTIETEKEKEVEVIKMMEPVDDKKSMVADLNVGELSSEERSALIEKVKSYLGQQQKEKKSNQKNVAHIAIDPSDFKVVYFDFNTSNLSAESKDKLKLLLLFLKENPESKIEIVGHGDSKGSWETNLKLSEQRTQHVYDFLIANKIASNRMFYYGKGNTAPAADNDTEESRSKNRRVEVFVLK